jgi:hypothetical protein
MRLNVGYSASKLTPLQPQPGHDQSLAAPLATSHSSIKRAFGQLRTVDWRLYSSGAAAARRW